MDGFRLAIKPQLPRHNQFLPRIFVNTTTMASASNEPNAFMLMEEAGPEFSSHEDDDDDVSIDVDDPLIKIFSDIFFPKT